LKQRGSGEGERKQCQTTAWGGPSGKCSPARVLHIRTPARALHKLPHPGEGSVASATQRGLCTCARQRRQRTGLNPHPSEGSVEEWCALARAPHLCTPARALHAPSMWLAMGGSVWRPQILATGSSGPRGGRLCCLVSEHAHWTFPSGACPVCVSD